jgi:methionyl-tRNA formyltransferase
MRILFFGTSEFAVPTLERLTTTRDVELIGVVTQPDKPAGRGGAMHSSPVAETARRLGLPLFQPKTLKDEAARQELLALSPDLLVVAAYGKILPKTLLDAATVAPLNLHGSVLPKYRGASPIQSAILEGESETGVTLMRMDEEVDHGPTYAEVRVPIDADETAATLEKKLASAGATLLVELLPAIASGALTPVEQDHAAATFTKLIDKEDGVAMWAQEGAARLERKLRAYSPWPGLAFTWMRGEKKLRVKITRAAVLDGDGAPGTVFVATSGNPAVFAKEGSLELLEVQPEGKQPMPGKAFLNGHRDFSSATLASS